MNKKAIGLLLALGMAASLAACGGDTTTPTTGESPAMSPDAMSPGMSPSPTTTP